ncbi:MAG: PAS domain S-box protein [Acidobacteriota bacterium]|nr:MAG: PAS domain S-box protein [Acidobacteriota bacterium]
MRSGRLAYILLLAAAGVLLVLSSARGWRESSAGSGFELDEDLSGVVVRAVDLRGPAAKAGLRAGDRLLAIGGTPVRTKLVALDALSRVTPGSAVGIEVFRDGETLALRCETTRSIVWRWDRIVAAAVAVLFCLGGIAVLVRPRGTRADLIYAAWCLTGALLLGVTWGTRGDRFDWLLFWIDRGARLLFPALWIHLVIALGSRVDRRRWLPVVYAPAAALMIVELHVVALGGALRAADPIALVDALQNRVEMAWISAGLLAGLLLLVPAALSAARASERARARWMLAGTAAGLLPFVLASGLPRLISGTEPSWSWAALPFLALVPLTFTGAVIEYRLMDLALFGRRVLATASMLTMSLLLFLGLLSVARVIVPMFLDPAGMAPALVAVLITAALAPAVRAGTRELVGRIYYRERYSFRRALGRVAQELNSEQELSRLTRVLERRVGEALDAAPVSLLLAGERGSLLHPIRRRPVRAVLNESLRARLRAGETVALADVTSAPKTMPLLHRGNVHVLVPLRVEGELIALLAVGARRGGGGLLDSDDLDLLRSVADHAAAAVAGALHLDELRDQVELVQRLQARTEALIDSSPIGMAVVDAEGRLRHWNPALERLLGASASSVLGKPFEAVLPAALRPLVRQALETCRPRMAASRAGRDKSEGFVVPDLEAADVRAYRVRVVGREQRGDLVLNLAASPLRGVSGDEGLLLTVDDVTERVELEERLIQQDRLASVGMLAAGVAHEVNTPLTGISSFAQILLGDTPADDPRRPLLEKVVRQAQRASQIARGLLTISRPGTAEQLTLGPVELGEIVEETIGLLGPQVRKARARVSVEGSGETPLVEGDRSRLQQVVMNLLLNALDAVTPGGDVVLRCGVAPSGHVLLEVEDDGVGIPEEVRGRIFDPFFTTKASGRGTGLGLSISYAIVREHGGQLYADSEPGRGTVMRVLLPAAVRRAFERQAG